MSGVRIGASHVVAVDLDAAVLDVDRGIARQLRDTRLVVQRQAIMKRLPRDRAIHGAGVNVAIATTPSATARATVPFPAPDGPSIATIKLRLLKLAPRAVNQAGTSMENPWQNPVIVQCTIRVCATSVPLHHPDASACS